MKDSNATISSDAFSNYSDVLEITLNGVSDAEKPWGYTGENITIK